MACVRVRKPDIIRIEYRAGADDPERYRCAWADFEFDRETYSLQIWKRRCRTNDRDKDCM